ncbi:MAG: hypothetical protein WD604_09010 [Balneolaceae bacterium]
MNIISDFAQDIQTSKPVPGSYEWWYFDVMSANGVNLVVIFYEGNPFSSRYIQSLNNDSGETAGNFPAISIAVYTEGKPLYYGFVEVLPEQAFFSASEPKGNTGNSSFHGSRQGGRLIYTLELNQTLINGDSISGKLIFESPENVVFDTMPADSGHTWNLVQPKSIVSGKIKISGTVEKEVRVNGTGYHDHNSGTEPLKESFDEWYWGRYHFDDLTMIYYLIRTDDEWEKKAWLIYDEGMVSECSHIHSQDSTLTIFGLRSSKKMDFAGEKFRAFLQKNVLLDNGPFYQRFEGRMILEEGKEMKQAKGISEYLCPHRIYNKLFWPLVNMRIRYPGKEHWVQKNPKLYRWTW